MTEPTALAAVPTARRRVTGPAMGCSACGSASPPQAARPRLATVRVLILTTFDLDEHVFGALSAGASGFLLKDATPEEIVQAVRVVAAGESLLAPAVTTRLVREFATRPTVGRPRPGLL